MNKRARIIAFHLPRFHPTPELEKTLVIKTVMHHFTWELES